MGDLDDWSVLEERSSSPLSPPPLRAPSDQLEFWQRAEEATRGIIAQVHPTLVSEERRRAVIDYVQILVKTTLGCEVYPFGSVPLKTYLPDGDIDLTAFGGLNLEEALASEVCSVLEREEHNGTAQFVVKDVQLIRAEVKLVKCLVQNIVVDISFNQLGGLCTLCFLEKIDHLIGKDHLFKRSIILIKTWCYYESRILGAHHGLISTYALETLVLYIFHLFHSSLNGPLAVLYKFLDYFSKFDWDNYCISLNGPLRLSSLPEVIVETPDNSGQDLLLTSEFLKECLDMYSVSSRGFETNSRAFPSKHLNIVDPLRENNNLGRSVSKGNFYRIRSAFTYGARKLGRIISQSKEDISVELRKFFSNTIDRHGSGERPDVLDSVPFVRCNEYAAVLPTAITDICQVGQPVDEAEPSSFPGSTSNRKNDHEDSSYVGTNASRTASPSSSGSRGPTAPCVSERRFVGDAKDLATVRIQSLDISEGTLKSLHVRCKGTISPLSGKHHPLHHTRTGEIGNGKAELKQRENPWLADSRGFSDIHINEDEDMPVCHEDFPSAGSIHQTSVMNIVSWPEEDIYLYQSGHNVSGSPNLLSDLAGDYDNQLNSLRFGYWWLDHLQNCPLSPQSPPMMSQFRSNNSWEVIRRAMPFRQDVAVPINSNRVVPRQVFYPVNPQSIPGTGFGNEELPKSRGTGTYFPNMNHYRDRPFSPRGRMQHATRSPRNNGRSMMQSEMNFPERGSHKPQFYAHQGGPKNGSYGVNHTDYPENSSFPDAMANGSTYHPHEKVPDFGSTGHLQAGLSSPDSSKQSLDGRDQALGLINRPKPIPTMRQDRAKATESYHLTDEDDFPPL
ncbi:PREDICTED: uncharacterized protein LOC104806642 isoform X2 [Tarenaya hassleriana]|uniref:uncharacterized protein LOC104806642 isoform X2 n=1 Tax=Tarenaya hassleriana TaxID=28532 RepID=UPI00053C9327|nr:PREDICTED: uncharacterized protein LOC104806642 isoform X2 [Tarenaya hassleriana]